MSTETRWRSHICRSSVGSTSTGHETREIAFIGICIWLPRELHRHWLVWYFIPCCIHMYTGFSWKNLHVHKMLICWIFMSMTFSAASLSSGSFLAKPYHQTLEAYMHRLKWANGSFSDCIAFLMAYRAWEKAVNNQMFRRRRDEYEWCRKNFLQVYLLIELCCLVIYYLFFGFLA